MTETAQEKIERFQSRIEEICSEIKCIHQYVKEIDDSKDPKAIISGILLERAWQLSHTVDDLTIKISELKRMVAND